MLDVYNDGWLLVNACELGLIWSYIAMYPMAIYRLAMYPMAIYRLAMYPMAIYRLAITSYGMTSKQNKTSFA